MFSNSNSYSTGYALEITGKDVMEASVFRWLSGDTRYGQR